LLAIFLKALLPPSVNIHEFLYEIGVLVEDLHVLQFLSRNLHLNEQVVFLARVEVHTPTDRQLGNHQLCLLCLHYIFCLIFLYNLISDWRSYNSILSKDWRSYNSTWSRDWRSYKSTWSRD
jgi:hypothetical protein